ncbi:ScbR family autoregulator-binding transcription factor [Streptomyces sp. NPDC003023]|uniref:ScbR family autoregulator-binding transcription factor n=1 Tax=Streptomyces sp. NPDC003023 TaxID=3364675 RepID=UPI00369681A8
MQQERALRTRETIMRAAAEVFDEFGFAGASISKIMKQSGLTQGAMYFHFDSKEDLARAVMHAQADTITPHVGSQGLQRLVDITLVWSRQLQKDPLLRAGVRLTSEQNSFGVHDASPYQEWALIMEECLKEARDRGELRDGVDVHAVADFVVAACTGMQMYSWIVSGRKDLPKRTASMWQVLLPGIATAPALDSVKASTRRAGALAR